MAIPLSRVSPLLFPCGFRPVSLSFHTRLFFWSLSASLALLWLLVTGYQLDCDFIPSNKDLYGLFGDRQCRSEVRFDVFGRFDASRVELLVLAGCH